MDNMNANIPKNEAILALTNKLIQSHKLTVQKVGNLPEILKQIIDQNYFKWNNKILRAKGLPMGSPLSTLLAEIYIQHSLLGQNKIL